MSKAHTDGLANAGQFSNTAEVYDGARPVYQQGQIDRVLAEAGITPETYHRRNWIWHRWFIAQV